MAASFASAAALLGHQHCARAAVLEELQDGTVVTFGDGGSLHPPQSDSVPSLAFDEAKAAKAATGGEGAAMEDAAVLPAILAVDGGGNRPVAPSAGAVILDEGPVPEAQAKEPRRTRMPAPQRFGGVLSRTQQQMRDRAAEVARHFAGRSSVANAGLEEEMFVDLFTTMIHRESNFNPMAISPVGAGGLGQLMPATARELGVRDVFSPDENLRGSASYLASLLGEFGTPELALAAYNAGPGAVRKYGGIPPYNETRKYVSDICAAVARTAAADPAARESATADAKKGRSVFSLLFRTDPSPKNEVRINYEVCKNVR